MNYKYIYLGILFVLGIITGLCFLYYRKAHKYYGVRVKKRGYTIFKNYINNKNFKKEIEELMLQSGFRLTVIQYQIIRYVVIVTLIITSMISNIILSNSHLINNLFFLLIFFIITSPRMYFLGKKTPFKTIMDFFVANYKNKLNREIYLSISQIKNIAITRKDSSISADFVLEQITHFTKKTKPIFNKMIALWSLDKREEACKYFELAIGTKEAEGLTNIFRKLDNLLPYELYNQIVLLQQTINKERETTKILANENKSNLIYFIVVITSFIIMVNFVVVVYYLESINQLNFIQ